MSGERDGLGFVYEDYDPISLTEAEYQYLLRRSHMANRIDFRQITSAVDQGGDIVSAAEPVFLAANRINSGLKNMERAGFDTSSIISLILPKLIDWLMKKVSGGAQEPVAPPPITVPQPTPPPRPGEVTDPTPPAAPVQKVLTTFSMPRGFWYQTRAVNDTVSPAEFKAVLTGNDPMIERSRFAFNSDSFDQFGNHYFTDKEDPLFWRQPGEEEPNTHRMRWFLINGECDASIEGAGVNGMTPKVKIHPGSLPEKGRHYKVGDLYGVWTFADGSTFTTPTFVNPIYAKR